MPSAPASAATTAYKDKVKALSERIVLAQKPIRILDSIKWENEVEDAFRASKFKALPKIDRAYYEARPVNFDPRAKADELAEVRAQILRDLGKDDSIGKLLTDIVDEYALVVELLLNRGTKRFGEVSARLYGATKDMFADESSSIVEMSELLHSILEGIDDRVLGPEYPENIGAQTVVDELNQRFDRYFLDHKIQAKISDGIVADAAAGGDTVKIKQGALFSERDIDILEVHEGWVHVGTTQNGNAQPIAKWLSKGPPRVSSTQEGLAVMLEIFTFRSYPRRLKQINDRILAIDKSADGANFLDIFEFYRTQGYSESDCFTSAKRVFRGGVIEGGAPFTKDISYCRGFVENYNFIRTAIRAGRPQLIPFMFVGKTRVDDVPLLYQKHQEGLVDAPRYLPPQFRDLNGVAVWMSFSSFFNVLDLGRIQEHYNKLFKLYS